MKYIARNATATGPSHREISKDNEKQTRLSGGFVLARAPYVEEIRFLEHE